MSGPFTVESLLPHPDLSLADDDQDGEVSAEKSTQHRDFASMILHAHFTGRASQTRLQRALHPQIDEDAWASLYRTESRPFPAPTSGQIPIKVINHFGDEVMKVYNVPSSS